MSEYTEYDTENTCSDCGALRQCRQGEPDGFGWSYWHCRECDEWRTPPFPVAGKVVLLFLLGILCALMAFLTMPKG